MTSLPKPSTIFSWIIYFIPIYIFVLAPLVSQFFPPAENGAVGDEHSEYDADGDLSATSALNDSLLSLEDGVPFDCHQQDDYRVHLLRRDPLVIYIEGFLKDWEVDHLVDVSMDQYTPSVIYSGHTERFDPTVRLSDRALLQRDNVVRCIEDRARSFQGWKPHLYIERMWTQRYNTSGYYQYHYDWSGSSALGGDRISTFMVYLGDNCTGGGTNFPRMSMPRGQDKWCRFVECDEDAGDVKDAEGIENKGKGKDHNDERQRQQTQHQPRKGITFKPIKGNAIFWENLRADGTGYPETWHAAFPVTSGTKIGLNIWSWYQPPRWRKGR